MSRPHLFVLAALLFAGSGCLVEDASSSVAALEGTPEAVGVLRFLNGPDATFEVLDIDAALDVRAARNIVDHVRGSDGELGTADDDWLDDIAELDAIKWVGAATIDRIVAYVDSIGLLPTVEVEGVALTDAEVEAIVAAANGASEAQLDVDAALDARAARNLVADRPHADIDAVAAVAYVGPSALEKLRRYAPGWTATEPEPEPEPEPPVDCTTSVTGRLDGVAADFDRLLALATTGDWPYAEVVARQASCLRLDDAAGRDALVAELVQRSGIDWQFGPNVFPSANNVVQGPGSYLNRMASALDAIEVNVDDGSWDPSGSADGTLLWEARHDLYDALTAPAAADPDAFYSVRLYIEAAECSQDATALIDPIDGRIWIIHRFPGC